MLIVFRETNLRCNAQCDGKIHLDCWVANGSINYIQTLLTENQFMACCDRLFALEMDWKALSIKLIFGDTKVSSRYIVAKKVRDEEVVPVNCFVLDRMKKQWKNYQLVTLSRSCSMTQDDKWWKCRITYAVRHEKMKRFHSQQFLRDVLM